MSWVVEYLPEANQDLKNLDGSQRLLVLKAIKKVQQNPISIYEGGYGKPPENKNGSDLSRFYDTIFQVFLRIHQSMHFPPVTLSR